MSALDTSVTLDEVFQVVHAKRVPVAAELAGYLALEIAEGASAGHGAAFEIDPRAVYIGDEGSVALVRPRGETGAARTAGDTEASVRSILARLLDASGSKTPALGQVASRPSGAGLGVLVEELENALIPVNRAAGRRALARLAREVKRVTQGVGRNAASSVSAPRLREDDPRMRDSAPMRARPAAPPAARDDIGDLLDQSAPPPFAAPPPARAVSPASTRVAPPSRAQAPMPAPAPVRAPPPPAAPEPARSGLDELLADFAVSGPHEDEAMARELKALVGLEPTPPPALSGPGASPFLALASPGEFIPSSPPPAYVPTPPPPHVTPAGDGPVDDGGIEALLAETANLSPVHGGEQPVQLANPVTAQLPAARDRPRTRGAVPAREISRSLQDAAPRPRTDRLLLSLALIIALAGGAAVWVYRPQLFAPKTPPTVDSSGNPVAAGGPGNATGTANGAAVDPGGEAGAGIRPTRDGACRGSLAINDAPDGAEVLILEGQAPLDVGSMPVGARLEFVATHDGYAPKRTVVPADAQWDKPPADRPDAGSRYEVGVQLDPTKAKAGSVDPWPSAEPGTSVGGDGPPGVVHVASTPKGAEVWLLAGLGPATRIDQIRCDADVDVLVAGPTTFRKRLHASASDFASAPATQAASGMTVRTVTLSAK